MYYLVFAFLYLLSLLPLRVLYLLSDFAYFIIYHLVGYRKNVVLHNLSIAFPQKSEEERVAIAKGFYKNFCDTFIETIKFISAPKSFFVKHFKAYDEEVNKIYESGRSVQYHLGHNFNWELANCAYPFFSKFKILAVYLPLHSKIFERLFRYIRTRSGSHLIASTNFSNDFAPHKGTQYLIGLVADQNPSNPHNAYWINFFGRPTPFVRGPEKAAKRNNLPVVFYHFKKVKRGYYTGHAHVATLNPIELPEGELTRMYVRFLEGVMREQPQMWLWSHRRWKFDYKPEYGRMIADK
jgi:Kdo2-lipid IVA lauroyltransferase/acyltransferase